MDGDAGFDKWQIGDDWKSRVCPRRLVTSEARAWIQLYSTYKAGHLLQAGGIVDQPAIYVWTMTKIESLIAEASET